MIIARILFILILNKQEKSLSPFLPHKIPREVSFGSTGASSTSLYMVFIKSKFRNDLSNSWEPALAWLRNTAHICGGVSSWTGLESMSDLCVKMSHTWCWFCVDGILTLNYKFVYRNRMMLCPTVSQKEIGKTWDLCPLCHLWHSSDWKGKGPLPKKSYCIHIQHLF